MLGNQPPGFMILPTEAGTRVETTDRYLDRGGPQVDHLAQLVRRQRRRQAIRRLLGFGLARRLTRRARTRVAPTLSAPLADPQWGSDGDVRHILAERHPARSVRPEVLDLRGTTLEAGRGASEALAALPRQADRRQEREHAEQGAVTPPGR